MPKDIKRELQTEPRKFGEIIETLEIIINEMMADDHCLGKRRYARCEGHEQRHVMRRRVCDRLERV